MATLQGWLLDHFFDWQHGRVIVRDVTREPNAWGNMHNVRGEPREARLGDPVLTAEFEPGFGGPRPKPMLAFDAAAIYFVHEYDGSTCLQKIYKDPQFYLDGEDEFDEYGF